MSQMSREQLLGVVREAYAERDPMPTDLVARMQSVARSEDAGVGLDLELMVLVDQRGTLTATRSADALTDDRVEHTDGAPVPSPRGARRVGAAAYTLRFVLGEIDLLVRVATDETGARIDGWVVPPEPMTVRALPDARHDGQGLAHPTAPQATTVGESGRFELTGLDHGLLRLRFEAHDGSRAPFATPTFEI